MIAFEHVARAFEGPGGRALPVLRDVCLEVAGGEAVAVLGRSGSGKSTLLHLAAGIDTPSAGVVRFDGQDLARLSDRERTRMRRDQIGMVFQFFHLLPHLSVADNVALPDLIAGEEAGRSRARVAELLARVGLADRAASPVELLSGGEKQRVALCRALLRRPGLLVADEPTGNLDDAAAREVMEVLLEMVRAHGATLLLATHSREAAALADRVFRLHDGVLEES